MESGVDDQVSGSTKQKWKIILLKSGPRRKFFCVYGLQSPQINPVISMKANITALYLHESPCGMEKTFCETMIF